MDIQKIKELALANGFKLKEQASGNMDLHSYVYEFAQAVYAEAQKAAVPDGFVAVPKDDLLTILCNCSDAMSGESTSSVYDKTGEPSTWFDHHVVAEKNILSSIPDAQEQSVMTKHVETITKTKTYKYALFLRHPETKETQHGTVEIDSKSFLGYQDLFTKLANENSLAQGYTLIAMQIISVSDAQEQSE